MQADAVTQAPVEAVFNPASPEYLADPFSQWRALSARGRLVWYEPWQAWIMTRMPDIMDCWRREYLSSDFYDWEFAPPRPPQDQWSNYERAMIGHSLLADHGHHRLVRRIVSPAFSRNVVDEIQRRIRPDVVQLIADLEGLDSFDYIERVANHIPFISISRMVGLPEKYWPDIKQVVLTFTESWNPTISDERREAARQDSNRAIEILQRVIAERRANPGEDDFLSELLKVEAENEAFSDWDIITLILALIGAGADTTLVAQQWTLYALLKHPEQIETALSSPEAFANAFSEIMRWSPTSKMGFARYAPQDMELLGQQLRKGQMVLLMPHLKDRDPDYYPEPERFDVQRTFDPDVLFGYGPRYCIGAAMAKRQLYLTMVELFKRFPDLRLDGEPEKDNSDHNAVVFKSLRVRTGKGA
ncbi:cytochrome P450 [Parahaliea mediterranea]|uniref:Cytochrome P450 n=1 Tax=Parahaliea mediterranea TaxID=651086 RepID=A0A939DBR7_9GAMM|nr:cytochrome P450 [Parahaliea mediterranea]MBN7795099.1 cytochrome P450 [Parahaliea mediterranea]